MGAPNTRRLVGRGANELALSLPVGWRVLDITLGGDPACTAALLGEACPTAVPTGRAASTPEATRRLNSVEVRNDFMTVPLQLVVASCPSWRRPSSHRPNGRAS